MIAIFVISLLLGASLAEPTCEEIQEKVLGRFQISKLQEEGAKTIKIVDADRTFEIEKPRGDHHKNTANAFVVQKPNSEDLPTITYGGKTYKFFSYTFAPLEIDQSESITGSANLNVCFSLDGYNTPSKAIFFIVPLILGDTKQQGFNADLNKDLADLIALKKPDYRDLISITWLKDLLSKSSPERVAKSDPAQRNPELVTFITDCTTVSGQTTANFFVHPKQR